MTIGETVVGGDVVVGMVATVELVGTKVEAVGGGWAIVVVGSGWGAWVVAVVVCTGGEVDVGAAVPVFRGAVVTTGARVVAVVPPGPGPGAGATVVLVVSREVDVGTEDEVGPRTMVLRGLNVVVVVARTVLED